jgi:peptide-methionine (S)-S-oxide reductase
MRTPNALLPALLLAVSGLTGLSLAACRNAASTSAVMGEPDAHHETTAARVRRAVGVDPGHAGVSGVPSPAQGHALAAFSAGCFWGVEDNFRQVPGVTATAVGYTGGHTEHPSYEAVCTHTTGHAETVLVEFDPAVVPYETLLSVFFKNHDPTTKNRQGPDVGDQYRSAIFTFSPEQAAAARAAMEKEQASHPKPIVTAIAPAGAFWKAEEYHQQYDEKTGTHSCPLPRGLAPEGS